MWGNSVDAHVIRRKTWGSGRFAYAVGPDDGRPENLDYPCVAEGGQAQRLGAHGPFVRLPEGYETPVGERGLTLTGGERKRISLARAFLREHPEQCAHDGLI
jgi:hypothetical protein